MAKERSSPEGKTVLLQGIMASGNPVVLADLKGRISFANPACEHLLGYRREELLGESLSILYSAETQGRFRRILQEAKAKGFGQGELELVKRDGTRIDGQVSMTLLQDGSGYEEIIVINRDISELMTLRKELKQQAEELAVRDELLHILGRSLDLEAGLEEALERVLRLVGFQIGGIALVDRERGVLVPKVHRGIPTAILRDLEREPFQLDEGLSGVAMERREPLVIEDLARDPRVTRRTLKESGLRMVIIVPLLAQERIVGFLYLLSKRPLEIPPERLRLLQAAGDQMGAAVENFQLFLKEQRRLSQLFLMGEIARKASSILDLERLLDEAAAEIQRTFNYHDVLIFFADQERRELVRKAWAGYYRRQGPKEERIPITDQGILSWVVRHGQTALVNDVRCDPRYEALFPQTRAELCVPLKREGRVIGGINVESIQANAFDETDAAVLEALADQLVVAISNAQLYQRLEEQVARRTEALRTSQERLQALSQVAAKIQGVLDEQKILALATEEFAKLGFIASFWSVEDGGRAIVRRHFALRPELLAAMRRALGRDPVGFKLPLDQIPHHKRALKQRKIIVLDGLQETLTYRFFQSHPEVLEPLEREVDGVIYAPLLVRGEAVGLMTFAFPQMTEADIRTVETFAHHLSIALENARLFRELECSYERLKQAQKELLQAERLAAVGQLAGSIAHQLRNPLGVIRNCVFYLKSKLKGQERKVNEHLELIEEEIRRVDKRISDLLTLAYRSPPRPRRVELRSLLERVLAQVKLPKGIELTMEFAERPLWVEADPQQMEQVCRNIIENALQVMGTEGQLLIRGYEEDEVVLEFADSGPGLSREEAARVFEPLFTTKAQGTGLGLTICRQIIEAHGGRIDFGSEEGRGSRVTVRLPIRRASRDG